MTGSLCVFGEVLFDHFPDGQRVLGGAPFNVAWHLQAFGQRPFFISRVGADSAGARVREAMHDWGMATAGLQTDPALPTGRVDIEFRDGEPHYDIVNPSAFDRVASEDRAHGPQIDFLCHGSLALRDPVSRQAAESLRSAVSGTVFMDVNLRQPWWQREQVLEMVRRAQWIKLNQDELDLLDPSADAHGADRAFAFLEKNGLDGLLLTRGSAGAEAVTKGGERIEVKPMGGVDVVDTVGAGDGFASVTILGLVSGWPLELTLERAQQFASAIVGRRGATVADPMFYRGFIDEWQLG